MRSKRSSSGSGAIVLLAAAGLWPMSGCGGADAQFQSIVESHATARDALKKQGAKFTEKKVPFLGVTHAVDLSGATGLTDETFANLKGAGMTVTELDLSRTNVRDEQLAQLAPGLGHLNLSGTEITDKGLEHLTQMGMLAEIDLTNTKVTQEGVEAFYKARADNPAIQMKKPKIKRK